MRVSSLFIVTLAAQLLSAAGSRVGEVTRQLNRAEALTAKGLECSVATAHGPSDLEATLFEYWYAMGSEGPVDQFQQNVIETRIFDEAMKGMVWCTRIQNETRRHLTETARELGIIAVNSGSATVQTKCKFRKCQRGVQCAIRKLYDADNDDNDDDCSPFIIAILLKSHALANSKFCPILRALPIAPSLKE
jgi:hypothetical protein